MTERNLIHSIALGFLTLLTLNGCTRSTSKSAQLSLSLPSANKVGALSGSTVLRHLVVHITGAGIAEPIHIELDSKGDTPLSSQQEVTVPAGSARLVQVLAAYNDEADQSMMIKYGDRLVDLNPGINSIDLIVKDIVNGFQQGTVSGRFLTSANQGPTGRFSVKLPVGNGRPDMVIEYGQMYNGWFEAFAGGNVGLKYVMDSGLVLFDSLNISALSGANFAPGADHWMRVTAPPTIYVLESGVWKPDAGRYILTGYFTPEGSLPLLAGKAVCRSSNPYTFSELASSDAGADATFGILGGGTFLLTGEGGHGTTDSTCGYGGPIGGERHRPDRLSVDPRQYEGNHGDSISGMNGVFTNGRDSTEMVKVSGNYSAVSTGQAHTCAIATGGGALYCWGANGWGPLGDNTTVAKSTPTLIDSGTAYADISAGDLHTCGVDSSNNLKCWGMNTDGQLGILVTGGQYNSPQAVGSGYSKVSAGGSHTCAIKLDGSLHCFGSNFNGKLGDGTTTDRNAPTAIDGGTTYAFVDTGGYNTCGITTAGVLKCWGYNNGGQIGDNTLTDRLSPVVIDSGVTYSKVAVGSNAVCGITTAGVLKCWGSNGSGILGDGTTTQHKTPMPVTSAKSFTDVAVTAVTACALATDNSVNCWGFNSYGGGGAVRGDHSTDSVTKPAAIYDGLFNFTMVKASQGHTCGLEAAGGLTCWGSNTYGELGGTSPSTYSFRVARRIETPDVKAMVMRPMPGLLIGDDYGGNYFDGVSVFMKANMGDMDHDSLECTPEFMVKNGFAAAPLPVKIEPRTRSITFKFGSSWPAGQPSYVVCPTKSGVMKPGGAWLQF